MYTTRVFYLESLNIGTQTDKKCKNLALLPRKVIIKRPSQQYKVEGEARKPIPTFFVVNEFILSVKL